MFYVILLAETNRTPFDLPEAEAELVSGFNVEYSSMLFAMFSLAEYNSMLIMSAIYTIFFLGGWSDFLFTSRLVLVAVSFVFVRALLPRYRYDQLMSLCWRVFLPFGLGFILFICGFAYYFSSAVSDSGFVYSSSFSKLAGTWEVAATANDSVPGVSVNNTCPTLDSESSQETTYESSSMPTLSQMLGGWSTTVESKTSVTAPAGATFGPGCDIGIGATPLLKR